MKISDEYLREKAEAALSGFFRYLSPALKLAESTTVLSESASEKKLLARYNHDNPKFQARTSTFVLEAFHIIELVLKAMLLEHGEHFLFESLDDYLERRNSAPKLAQRRQAENARVHKIFADCLLAKKELPAKPMKEYIKRLKRTPVDDFGKSVSPRIAYKRLRHFEPGIDAKLSEDVLERLTALRNQIVHFGDMSNLLQGMTDALQCLLIVCQLRPQRFPLLAQMPARYAGRLASYAELMPFLILHELMPRIVADLSNVTKRLASSQGIKPAKVRGKRAG